jgi:hypothetical protein
MATKKIQVSTVQQTADVEVLFVNARIISKVFKAKFALDAILKDTRTARVQCDDEGNPVLDENGKTVIQKDENGNIVYDYSYRGIRDASDIVSLHEVVKSFIDELAEAFES